MTDMETAVMNFTGCDRQTANLVANTILNMDMEANREFEDEQENGEFENE